MNAQVQVESRVLKMSPGLGFESSRTQTQLQHCLLSVLLTELVPRRCTAAAHSSYLEEGS